MNNMRRIWLALSALGLVILAGTLGYVALGFSVLDALYQTVTTVTTVGFREVEPLNSVGKAFTIGLILAGVGTALYALGVLLEAIIEGHLLQHMEVRRMQHTISHLDGHVIICGLGRVGRASAQYLAGTGQKVVIIDRDPALLADSPYPTVSGDVSDDAVLVKAGILRARALIAALDTDADNVFVTLSSRALNPDLVIVARARSEESKSKLLRAGANRAVNPQLIGGRRMGSFAMQPYVAEFLDEVMHDEGLEFRIEQVEIDKTSALVATTLAEAGIEQATGVLLLALRPCGSAHFVANPSRATRLESGSILIAIGTPIQLDSLRRYVRSSAPRASRGR